jgi:uncharacterized protein (TIGR03083 family)
MDLGTLYRSTVESWSGKVSGIADDQWDLPTPCSDWTVRDLVNHVVGEDLWTPPLVDGRTIEEVGDQFDGDLLGDDPIGTAQAAAAAAITATSAALPDGGIVSDHLVHEWDLAAAIGAPRQLDPTAVGEVTGWFANWEELYRGAGAVGPRVEISEADPQSALLAGFGRDPGWAR